MFNFERINLTFSFSAVYFFVALILLTAYAIYVYRYTIPRINRGKKIFLVSLRVLALLLILFIIFEPILTLTKKEILEPVNLIFADNSRSILIDDGTNRSGTIKSFLEGIKSNKLESNSELHSFGSKENRISFDSLGKINFTEGSTNFSEVFSDVKKTNRNISSIVIASDGVITEGANPLYTAEKLNIPVYTIGVGDTTRRNDIEVKNVAYNQFIYAETPTSILTTITNKGFAGKNVTVSLFENDVPVDRKNITLNSDGIQNIKFSYTSKSAGEKKLTISVQNVDGEFSKANNKKVFYINVLSNKIKVLVLGGAPSADLTFIKNSLEEDENLTVHSLTLVGNNKFVEKNNPEKYIDSADIFFMIGFPSKEVSANLIDKIAGKINEKDKPFFITTTNYTDYTELKTFENQLPFSVKGGKNNFAEVQPNVTQDQQNNPLLQNNKAIDVWNNLPPVLQPQLNFSAKPGSETAAKIKMNNVPINTPLIVSRRIGSKRSIAVLAKDIWRWKLQASEKESNLFDQFIHNSVKWLNANEEQKQVTIKTSKKTYTLGEPVEFSAQVYDESFNPINDAEVKIKIKQNKEENEINLNSLGSGLYEGSYQTIKAGDYSFSGDAFLDGKILGSDAGKFNIGEVDVEMMNPAMNYEFLKLLSSETGGKFYFGDNYNRIYDLLKQRNKESSKEKINVSEINLWSNEWLMIAVIFLFALEWFFRKRAGML